MSGKCGPESTYFVFHGTSKSKRPIDWVYPSTGEAKTTIVGHGAHYAEALEDAKRHEAERGPGGYTFGGVAHVSGPHRRAAVPA
jgi:hypothetical protein